MIEWKRQVGKLPRYGPCKLSLFLYLNQHVSSISKIVVTVGVHRSFDFHLYVFLFLIIYIIKCS